MPVNEALKKAQDNYKKNNAKRGLIRVNLWVPKTHEDEIKGIAQEMREEHFDKQG